VRGRFVRVCAPLLRGKKVRLRDSERERGERVLAKERRRERERVV
jgi:hypothetical protein